MHQDDHTCRRTFLASLGCASILAAPSLSSAATPDHMTTAFVGGFPLFEFARTAWSTAHPTADRPEGAFNIVTHRRKLTDPASRIITTPNNDCLVSTARIDLTTGPLLLDIPTIKDRYFSVAFMDAFTDNFAFIGTRATRGDGGRFVLTPPGWRGSVPPGTSRIATPTADVWMLARILIDGPEDYLRVNALQDALILSDLGGGPPAAGTLLSVPPTSASDADNFLDIVNLMLGRVVRADPRAARILQCRDVGIARGEAGAFAALPADLQRRWQEFLPRQLSTLPTAGAARARVVDHWSYSVPTTGNFGSDDLQRAIVALMGLAALPPCEAFYGHALADSMGVPFDGARRYRLRVPPGGPPVDAFWSLTLYRVENDGRMFLAPNPIDRYSIGDRTKGLVYNPDGSLDILLQHDRPANSANWLPVPEGPFRPALRAYLARPALLSLKWKMPAIERMA